MNYILDTNIVTAQINQQERVIRKIQEVLDQGGNIFISVITDYEINRGLFASHAIKKSIIYETLRKQYRMLWLDDLRISEKAAEIYADLKQRGQLIQDADILIAATALCADFTVVSDDEHFTRIPALAVENWLNERCEAILTTAATEDATEYAEKTL